MADDPPAIGGPIRLLIVDDHPVVRDGIRGMFAGDPDFEVVGEAANGREAVARAAVLLPDVILMDLRMPELDGVERDQGDRRWGLRGAGAHPDYV